MSMALPVLPTLPSVRGHPARPRHLLSSTGAMRIPSTFSGAAALLTATVLGASADAADPLSLRVPGVLRVLASADEMPEVFSFLPRPPKPGFERELVEGFTRANRLEMRIVPVKNFDQIIPMLVKGEGDLIVGIVDTGPRRQKVSFTSETYPVRHLVVTRKPGPPVATLEEFRLRKVAVIPGTTWSDVTQEAGVGAANQLSVTDVNEALDALAKGRAQATMMTVFDFALAQQRDPALEAGLFVGTAGIAAWALRKEDLPLLKAINEYLFAVRTSPTKSQMLVKYFSQEALELLRRARKE
jgi:ABC-type amino acid transport substrate-binding protein